MIVRANILGLEERAMNAWPALQTANVGGWALRVAGGHTKRANSASSLGLGAGGEFAGVRRLAEDFYASQDLPPIFRITPLAPPQVDAELEAAGYSLFDPSLVMTGPADGETSPVAVEIETRPSRSWLKEMALASGITATAQPIHDAIVHAIGQPAAFATVHKGRHAVAFGLAVYEREMVGLFDIIVAPDMRGKGYGRAVTQALIAWGRDAGARAAYLQVRAANEAALGLYADLGFVEAYPYHYRLRRDVDQA